MTSDTMDDENPSRETRGGLSPSSRVASCDTATPSIPMPCQRQFRVHGTCLRHVHADTIRQAYYNKLAILPRTGGPTASILLISTLFRG